MINILYVALRYNYAKMAEGNSVEYNVLEQGWRQYCLDNGHTLYILNPDIVPDIDAAFNYQIENHNISIVYYAHFNDQYSPKPESWLKARSKGIKCLSWESDASWRCESGSLPRKDLFDHFVITHRGSFEKYKQLGMNPILSQWFASPIHIPDPTIPKIHEVTLIGQRHGIRGQIVNIIQDAGIDLHLYGNYWDGYRNNHGYIVDIQEMLRAKQSGKIALNLGFPWSGKTDISELQIKQRHISLPALRQCQITTWVDGIEDLFEPNKEIVIANSMSDLIDKIKYYLAHDEEREQIALNGYNRVQQSHLWSHRIEKLLKDVK